MSSARIVYRKNACETEEEEEEQVKRDAFRLADERFLGIVEKMCEGRIVSGVYLLGDGFREDWHERSLQFLCHSRRVFQGNNLFSRGAVYGILEKLAPSEAGQSHVFLGKDKLKSNIGMQVMRQGKESYLALLDAGENWYEIHRECEFLLGDVKKLEFIVRETGAPFTRYALEVYMSSADTVQDKVTDLGFGELFAANGQVWENSFQVS